jgi:tRNA(Ile2) C34 agmatinyltransferase TiaS
MNVYQPMDDDRPACVECGGPARTQGARCADCFEAAAYLSDFR